jgi:CrcB protein
MRATLIVFLGSGIGGACRHLVGLASLRLLGPSFPYGTLAVNVAGSTLIALVVALFSRLGIGGNEMRLFLATGILGGFTTWSTFTLDTVTLWERGQPMTAIGYVLSTLVLSLTAIAAVLLIARRLA